MVRSERNRVVFKTCKNSPLWYCYFSFRQCSSLYRNDLILVSFLISINDYLMKTNMSCKHNIFFYLFFFFFFSFLFIMYQQMWNEKHSAPPTFLCWQQFFTLPLYMLLWNKHYLGIYQWLFLLIMKNVRIMKYYRFQLVLELLPVQALSIHKASNLLQWIR